MNMWYKYEVIISNGSSLILRKVKFQKMQFKVFVLKLTIILIYSTPKSEKQYLRQNKTLLSENTMTPNIKQPKDIVDK